jgi:dsRNA-specific ribonuclease
MKTVEYENLSEVRKAAAADKIAATWKSGDTLRMSKGELCDFVADTLLEAGCDL